MKYYAVIDTETCADNLIFDLAIAIIDREGKEYARANFLVSEIVSNPVAFAMLKQNRYMNNDKYAFYSNCFGTDAKPEIVSFAVLRDRVNNLMREYNAIPAAYNAKFDSKVLDAHAQIMGFEAFFTDSREWVDIWNCALWTICATGKFAEFAISNNCLTDGGNIRTNAEVVYQFLSENPMFTEAHTAMADVKIECKILATCISKHKKMPTEFVGYCAKNPAWQKVQSYLKSE